MPARFNPICKGLSIQHWLSCFSLFETVDTQEIARVAWCKWQTRDCHPAPAAAPISFHFWPITLWGSAGISIFLTLEVTVSAGETGGAARFKRKLRDSAAADAACPISFKHNYLDSYDALINAVKSGWGSNGRA